VSSLVDKSLLQVVTDDGVRGEADERHFTLLETIRAYALRLLAASGEGEALRRRHAAYYVALAEEIEPELMGPRQASSLARLEREHDNLRAALRWARECGDRTIGLRLGAALWRFWWTRGYLAEGRRWLDAFLGLAPGAEGLDPVRWGRGGCWQPSRARTIVPRRCSTRRWRCGAHWAMSGASP